MSDTFKQAISLHQTGDFVAAEQCYIALLNNNDNDINRKNIHYLLGLLYSQIKQYDKAIYQLEQSLPLNRKNADLYNALAVCHQKKHQIKAAERFINIACKIAPANANYLNRKSKILISSNKLAQSIANASLCISKNPDFFPAYQSYVTACNLLLRPDNGLRLLKKACKLFQGNPEVLFSLAEAYMNTGKHIKAKKIFEGLSQEKYKTIACLNNLGNIEKDYGQTIAAKQYYEQALQLSPDNPATQWNLGLVQLLEGNYTSSWNQYDERLKLYNKSTCLDKVKTWKGENLNNKSIIILSEQGLGDEILFASSFNSVIQQAKRTYIECDPRLKAAFSRSFPKAVIISANAIDIVKIDKRTDLDYKIHAGSIFQHTGTSDTPKAYIIPPPGLSGQEKSKLAIGFSWKGATNYKDIKKRSTHLRDWLPLLSNDHYDFYCLQQKVTQHEHELLSPFEEKITFLDPSSANNIDELLSLIAKLDLVISVTNTNIHLAGAMGVKTLCLTPHNPDWPWGLYNDICKWYSSVKMIRKTGNDWRSVFNNIESDLNDISIK